LASDHLHLYIDATPDYALDEIVHAIREYLEHEMANLAALLHEMAQLATRRGLALYEIALFPTKTLSEFAFNDTVTHIRRIGDRWASLLPTAKVSTLHDLEQGKRLEVEETLGYAVRQSAALGIPTPTMDTCYKLIAGINHYLQ
jgi:ketopantoate reductase